MQSTKRQLKKLREEGSPSKDYKHALWSELSQEYDKRYNPKGFSLVMYRFATIGVAAFVLFVTTGAGVYAYESPDVVEGHPLHFMKQGIEQVEGGFAFTPERKARFHAKMLERRIREAEHHNKDKATVMRLAPKIAEELDMSVQELHSGLRNPDTRDELLSEIEEKSARYAEILMRVIEGELDRKNAPPVPEELRPALIELYQRYNADTRPGIEKNPSYRQELQSLIQEYLEERDGVMDAQGSTLDQSF